MLVKFVMARWYTLYLIIVHSTLLTIGITIVCLLWVEVFILWLVFHKFVLLTINQDSLDNQPFIIVSLRIKVKLIIPLVEKQKENVSSLAG